MKTTTMISQADGAFGPHLAVDMRGCDPDKLSDYRLVFDVLHRLPDEIGMTRITQPYVFPYSGIEPSDAGTTGTVIIAESHISIHTFTIKQFVFADVFSCRPFNCEKALEYLIRAFDAKQHDYWVVHRGRGFPRGTGPTTSSLKCDCGWRFDANDDQLCTSPHTGRSYWFCPYCGTPLAGHILGAGPERA